MSNENNFDRDIGQIEIKKNDIFTKLHNLRTKTTSINEELTLCGTWFILQAKSSTSREKKKTKK